MIIAIDGPAASGKGTLGKRLAGHFGLRHLDTGLIYRAVAKALLDAGHALDAREQAAMAAKALDPAQFDEIRLKSHRVGEAASIVSSIPEVRAALVAFQRDFGRTPPGAVLDGRDIGTVIFPDADVKFFFTAPAAERVARRRRELDQASGRPTPDAVLEQEIDARDRADREREIAPLRPATDAIIVATEGKSVHQVFDEVMARLPKR
jgi:CMP/dCMP kinase